MIMDKINEWFRLILTKYRRIILSMLLFLVSFPIALFYLFAYIQGDVTATASGRTNLSFRVFYLDNESFPYNPIPPDLHFLMSFTDFIEVESDFVIRFSEEVEFNYTYTAVKRLVVRYMATGDGNLNPIVFQEEHVLSEAYGQFTGNSIHFPAQDSSLIGGPYVIFPKYQIDTYLSFMDEQRMHMHQENVIAQSLRDFSAELFVDFIYEIDIPAWDLNEHISITNGYRFSLSTEVYSLILQGTPAFNHSFVLAETRQLGIPEAIALVSAISLSVYGFFSGKKLLAVDPNEQKQKANRIFEKYENEIIYSEIPLPLSKYTHIPVREFELLQKMAVSIDELIMCYRNERHVEFAVVVKEFAYHYKINYNENSSEDESQDAVVFDSETQEINNEGMAEVAHEESE